MWGVCSTAVPDHDVPCPLLCAAVSACWLCPHVCASAHALKDSESSALALDWLSSGASNAMGGRRTSSRSRRRRRAGTDRIRSIHMSDKC
jgi:hypothetical protein